MGPIPGPKVLEVFRWYGHGGEIFLAPRIEGFYLACLYRRSFYSVGTHPEEPSGYQPFEYLVPNVTKVYSVDTHPEEPSGYQPFEYLIPNVTKVSFCHCRRSITRHVLKVAVSLSPHVGRMIPVTTEPSSNTTGVVVRRLDACAGIRHQMCEGCVSPSRR